jgi:hypothetical protein
MANGARVTVQAHEDKKALALTIDWSRRGHEDWRAIAKYVTARTKDAAAALRKAGWRDVISNSASGAVTLSATVYLNVLSQRSVTIARGVADAVKVLEV